MGRSVEKGTRMQGQGAPCSLGWGHKFTAANYSSQQMSQRRLHWAGVELGGFPSDHPPPLTASVLPITALSAAAWSLPFTEEALPLRQDITNVHHWPVPSYIPEIASDV